MEKLIIYGFGSLGQEILALIRDIDPDRKRWAPIGFVDDSVRAGEVYNGLPVLGDGAFLLNVNTAVSVVFGFASPWAKAKLYSQLKQNPFISFPSIVHPSSAIDESVQMGEGCVITRFCFASLNATLGRCVFVNVGAQIGHDTRVGDFCSIMPTVNLSGKVTIGDRCLLGVQSVILQGLSVGSGTTVGIGSIVMQNLPENCTALGYPAEVIKKR